MKDVEPDDPMELNGIALPGNTEEAMAECFVEEYILQGFSDDMILRLFTNPFYSGTHAIWRARGEAYVKDLIARVRARWGQLRFRTTGVSKETSHHGEHREPRGEIEENSPVFPRVPRGESPPCSPGVTKQAR